jgi:disulfide bond formation protein DsbB
MIRIPVRRLALLTIAIGCLALGVALAAEAWGGEDGAGLVPCALCLLERVPYRVVIGLGALAFLLPPRLARLCLMLAVLALLADAAIAVVHVGVEQGAWPSPLPECAAPRINGTSMAQRLAQMPLHPAKPCDEPSFLVPGLPLSMTAMNLLYALASAALIGMFLPGTRRHHERYLAG